MENKTDNESKFNELLEKYQNLKIKYDKTYDELTRHINRNKELIVKLEKVDKSNFFEIQLNESYFIDTEFFKGVVTIIDQTNDFIKYKTNQNKIFYCNKSSLKILKILNI